MRNIRQRQAVPSFHIAAVIALAFIPAAMPARAEVVAEFPVSSFTGGITFFSSSAFRPAQTFTSLGNGELQGISVALAQNGPLLPAHVVIEFRQTFLNSPSGTVLASSMVNGSLLAGIQPVTPVMLNADFSAFHITLAAGAMYAFSLRTDDAGAAAACGSGGYNGGSLFSSHTSGTSWDAESLYDLNFRVTTVPEPAAFTVIGLAGMAFWCRRVVRSRISAA